MASASARAASSAAWAAGELAALLLACLLGGDALALGLGGASGLLGGSCLLLGLLGGLDFLGAGLDHRGELLADHGDIGVLQGGGSGLSGNLHIGEMTHQFLGGHAELFGQGGHTDFCHMTSPTLSGTLGALETERAWETRRDPPGATAR